MKDKQDQAESDKSADLRRRAEQAVRDQPTELDELSGEDARRLVHESRVHQVQLEMQNDELRRVQRELEASRDRYAELYDFAPVGYLTVGEQGTILEANLAGAALLGMHRDDLIGQSLFRFIAQDDQDVFYLHRKRVFETGITQSCKIGMVRRDGIPFCAQLESAAVQDSAPSAFENGHSDDALVDVEKSPGQYRITISDVTERVQAEDGQQKTLAESLQTTQSLRESKERFRALSELVSDLVYVLRVEPDGVLAHEWTDDALTRISGFTVDELEKRGGLVGLVHPDDRRTVIQRLRALLSGELVKSEDELRIVTKSGQVQWVHNYARAVEEQGRVVRIYGATQNITERVRAEAVRRQAEEGQREALAEALQATRALRESEERFRSLIEHSPIGISVTRGGITQYVNSAYLRMFGYSDVSEVAGTSLGNRIAPQCREQILDRNRRRERGEAVPTLFDSTGQRKDGSLFPFHAQAAQIELSDGPATIAFLTDLTESVRTESVRRQAEEGQREALAEALQATHALRESEEMYRTLIRVSPDAVTVNSPEGYFAGASQRAVELFGFENEQELVGKRVLEVITPQDSERAIADVRAIVEQGFAENLEYTLLRKDGTRFIGETSSALVKDEHGKPKAVIAITRDITERKRAEAALRRRNRDLELLNRVGRVFNSTLDLDQMLAAALEELRSLLEVTSCSVWLIDAQDSEQVCRQAAGNHNEIVRGWRLTLDEGIAGWVARHGKAQSVPDTRLDERHYKEIDRLTEMELRSILSIPLWVKEKEIGVLQLGDTTVGRFDAVDLALVESLAATAAIAIENGRLYEQARQDAETKATLLREVNHRIKNNLASIIGLFHAEQRHAVVQDQAAYHSVLQELSNRIQGLGQVHNMLSAVGWAPLPLDELAGQIVRMALQVLPRHKQVWIDVTPSPVRVSPRQANDLALIINELTTNTVKYALAERDTGQINVRITLADDEESRDEDDIVLFEFRDDGPGYPQQVLTLETHSVGLHLVKMLASHNLRGELTLHNDGGAVTDIRFKR